jgi:histidinol phosphatase-like enzyme (inositol monophosphatase family)
MRQTGQQQREINVSAPDYEAFLRRLAEIAASTILPHFRQLTDVESKDDHRFDPVTAADREAEQAMRAAIAAAYPDHGILGEEFGGTATDADFVWVIDPIDGTRSFISGIPIWGVLIGLMKRGRPSLGLMSQPFTGELFFGDGATAQYEGPDGPRKLSTRRCAAVEEAVLFTTSPEDFSDAERDAYQRVERQARLARYGTDCYAYCMLAAGFVDVVIEAQLQPHDIMPLIPIIEGAGGRVTDWQGNPPPATGQVLATGDARLHDQILALLSNA